MIRWLRNEWKIIWSTHRKWGVSLAALVAYAVNNDLVHGTALRWTTIVIGALAALGVRAVPNSPDPADPGVPPAGDAGMTVVELCYLVIAVGVAVLALVALGWLHG